MAYVPDQAILDLGEISGKAFQLYCYMCKCGSMRKSTIRFSLRRAAEVLGSDFSNLAKKKNELAAAGWIRPITATEIDLIKGFEVVENTTGKVIGKVVEITTKKVVEITTKDPAEVVKITSAGGKNYQRNIKDSLTSLINQQEKNLNHAAGAAEMIEQPAAIKRDPLGTRISVPFELTDELRDYAKRRAPDVDIEAATEEFENYWLGIPGKAGKKLDWSATWKNRMVFKQDILTKEAKRNGNNRQNLNGTGAARPHGKAGDSAAAIAAKYGARKPGQI